eukprot:CAMPEP_0205822174 /NCGR_PEP_ID=MMETSP0206-20130828/11256_1 /ASSEMBLY_ACC=CAM_ASM_000279 /TAXON_ID=36767 /ORGANISM="Euplotes focardii, Strain TN1" /LENGTH=213 /DNA_ID=CAMNT_0053118209 /DNA_START=694 /DNA_END=1335 /DNA_ORIENTATION=+
MLTAYSSVYRRNFKKGEKNFDGVEPRTETEGFTRYLDIPLSELKGKVDAHQFTDFTPLDGADMYLAEAIQPTTNGLHLNITYKLSVKLCYDTYCATEPECSTPLFIQAPELQNFQMIQAPENWSPTTYDEVNFALPVPRNELMQQEPIEMGADYNPQQMGVPAPFPQPQMEADMYMPAPIPTAGPQLAPVPMGHPIQPTDQQPLIGRQNEGNW